MDANLRAGVRKLLGWHLERYPLMKPQDAYKLLYQGVFGVGHIMREGARGYLLSEAKGLNLDYMQGEQLVDPVSVDGGMIRVNLRPFVRRGLPLSGLFDAMLASGVEGEAAAFLGVWDEYMSLVRGGDLGMDRGEAEEVDGGIDRSRIQARHHSADYRDAYRPAYRVVLRSEFDRLG